jgi:lipid II:glycine glycyltransferase (peptidoglycan interpeptide bridge formation enzyme)
MLDTTLSRLHPLLKQQAQEVFYYKQSWLDLLTKLYGYPLVPLTTTDAAGQITGMLPLYRVQSPLTGKRYVSLPFSDHCPLLTVDPSDAQTLLDQAITLAQKARYLELRGGCNDLLAGHSNLIESNLYVRWLLPLHADPHNVWTGLHKPVQRQIKKAQKLGVHVRFARKRTEMEQYYRLHLLTRMKHGMPAQPQRFFLALWDALVAENAVQLLLAEYEETVIAGMILLTAGSTVKYAYGASDEQFLQLAPNNLLLWTAITWGCAQGYRTLDLGRTARDNQGLMEFKRRWGASEERLPYYYYPSHDGFAATSEQSRKFQLLTACWKRLPGQIAGPLGGALYKHLG